MRRRLYGMRMLRVEREISRLDHAHKRLVSHHQQGLAHTLSPSRFYHHAAAAWALQLGLREWSISLSHDRTHAIAFVVGMGGR